MFRLFFIFSILLSFTVAGFNTTNAFAKDTSLESQPQSVMEDFMSYIEEAIEGGVLEIILEDPNEYESESNTNDLITEDTDGIEENEEYPYCVEADNYGELCCKKPHNELDNGNECLFKPSSHITLPLKSMRNIKIICRERFNGVCVRWQYFAGPIVGCAVYKKDGPPPHYRLSCLKLDFDPRYYFEEREDGTYICARKNSKEEWNCVKIDEDAPFYLPFLPGYPEHLMDEEDEEILTPIQDSEPSETNQTVQ